MADEDLDMREAGIIIGKALGSLRARLDAIEAEKPTFVVPVPKSEIKLPPMAVTVEPAKLEQKIEVNPTPIEVEVVVSKPDPIEIDLAGIVDAIASAGLADSIRQMGQGQEAAAAASLEAQAATQTAMTDMMAAIGQQQGQISSLIEAINILGVELIKAIRDPKKFTYDEDGEIDGVAPISITSPNRAVN